MTLRWLFFSTYLALAVFFLGGSTALAYVPPPLVGAVNDHGAMLTRAERDALEARIKAHRDAHGDEIVVLTVPTLGGETIEDVAYGAFNTWKIGQKNKDNGVLLAIAPKERKTRIETGKGVGDKITDLQSKRILSERVGPRLKEGKNFEGLSAGVDSIASLLLGGPIAPADATRPPPGPASTSTSVSFSPTSAFVDADGTFPSTERARFLDAYEARKKAGKAAFAVVIAPDTLAGNLPGLCGQNLAAFTRALPNVKGIVIVTRNGASASQYSGGAEGPGVQALARAIPAITAALPRAPGADRDRALVDGLVKALDGYDVQLPGLLDRALESPAFAVFAVLFLLFIVIVIGVKFAPSGGGGGGSSSSSWSSSDSSSSSWGSSDSSSSSSDYSGGGGSSGGGGASDDY